MKHRLIKTVRLSCIYLIGDEVSGCIHVTRLEKKRRFDRPLDLHQAIKVSPCVTKLFVEIITEIRIVAHTLIDDLVDSAST